MLDPTFGDAPWPAGRNSSDVDGGEDVRDVNDGLNTGAAAESDGGGGVGGMASEVGRDDGVGGSRTGGVGRGGRQVGGERAGREYVR